MSDSPFVDIIVRGCVFSVRVFESTGHLHTCILEINLMEAKSQPKAFECTSRAGAVHEINQRVEDQEQRSINSFGGREPGI